MRDAYPGGRLTSSDLARRVGLLPVLAGTLEA